MNRYLIFAECGGEMGNPEYDYGHYHICNGNDEEEALNSWYSKVEAHMEELYKNKYNRPYNKRLSRFVNSDGIWYESGYTIQIVHLKDSENYSPWKKLKWI